MVPELNPPMRHPQGSEDLGGGYMLLQKRDENMKRIVGPATLAIRRYMQRQAGNVLDDWMPRVR
jgi:hypothetical protein